MPTTKIIIQFDADKLTAIRQFLSDDAPNVEDELTAALEKQYLKVVPPAVRRFIEGKGKIDPSSPRVADQSAP